jgi:hypothetical protein
MDDDDTFPLSLSLSLSSFDHLVGASLRVGARMIMLAESSRLRSLESSEN